MDITMHIVKNRINHFLDRIEGKDIIMNYLHYDLPNVGSNDRIEVTLNMQANVLLLTPSEYREYQRGRRYRYYGGLATHSPTYISPPHQGHWHLVINLGGRAGRLEASIRVI